MPEIQSLTAIRGVAAIWIVLHHFWPQTEGSVPYIITKGYLAVDLFFILSGLVLFHVYQAQLRAEQFDFKRFALKRFARLYPVHFVTLAMAALILTAGPWSGFIGRELSYDLGHMAFLHLTLLHSWGLTETGGLNYPSWSLSAEAFAYLLFPTLAAVILKVRNPIKTCLIFLVLSVVTLELFWPAVLRNPTDTLVFTRLENDFGVLRIIPEFTLGIAIAHSYEKLRPTLIWVYVGTILIATGLIANLDLITVLGFAAFLTGCLVKNFTTVFVFRKTGELSYSIYMCHALIQIVGFKVIEASFGYDDGSVPTIFIFPMLGLTILCAMMLYFCVERPARHRILMLSTTKSAGPIETHSSST